MLLVKLKDLKAYYLSHYFLRRILLDIHASSCYNYYNIISWGMLWDKRGIFARYLSDGFDFHILHSWFDCAMLHIIE